MAKANNPRKGLLYCSNTYLDKSGIMGFLRRHYEVITKSKPAQCLQFLEDNETISEEEKIKIDAVILMDKYLVDGDGLATARAIRKTFKLPVLVLVEHVENLVFDLPTLLVVGPDWKMDDLHAAIENLLNGAAI
jgi:CheY-like chemotaxis protein